MIENTGENIDAERASVCSALLAWGPVRASRGAGHSASRSRAAWSRPRRTHLGRGS